MPERSHRRPLPLRFARSLSLSLSLSTSMHKCIHIYIYLYIYIHKYLYIYIYIYTYFSWTKRRGGATCARALLPWKATPTPFRALPVDNPLFLDQNNGVLSPTVARDSEWEWTKRGRGATCARALRPQATPTPFRARPVENPLLLNPKYDV